MEVVDIIKKLENSDEYKEWIKQNKGFYLVHLFFMTDQPIQVGYYHKELDKITTFEISEAIKVNPISEVFKDKKFIDALEIDKIKIDKGEAVDRVASVKADNYASEKLTKEMMIVQEHNGEIVYNITYFTESFKTINCKINAESGAVISHDCNSLVSF